METIPISHRHIKVPASTGFEDAYQALEFLGCLNSDVRSVELVVRGRTKFFVLSMESGEWVYTVTTNAVPPTDGPVVFCYQCLKWVPICGCEDQHQ